MPTRWIIQMDGTQTIGARYLGNTSHPGEPLRVVLELRIGDNYVNLAGLSADEIHHLGEAIMRQYRVCLDEE